MKKILILLLTLTLLGCIALPAYATGEKVVDHAGILKGDQIAALRDRAEELADAYQMDVVIVTVKNMGGKTAQAYADDYFDYNGYGYGNDHSGILILVSMWEREWAVSTCGSTMRTITDSEIDEIMESVLPHLSAGNYYDAFNDFLTHVEAEYAKGTEPVDIVTRAAIALIIGAVVALVALLIMRSRMNTAKQQHGAGSYVVRGSYDLYRCRDHYLYSRTTRVRKSQNNSSGGHRSSSGRSHGGRSGRF